MMPRHRAAAWIALISVPMLVGVGWATTQQTHVIREHQTVTQLLWSQEKGFIVSGVRRDGWTGTTAQYWGQLIAGHLGRPFQFAESRRWIVYLDITNGQLHRFMRDGVEFHFIEPFGGEIYNSSGTPRKWNGHGFEPIAGEEARIFKARPEVGDPDYSGRNGWSSRINLFNRGDTREEYPLPLTSGRVVVVADRTEQTRPTLRVQSEAGKEIYVMAIDERLRTIGGDEYERLMRGPIEDR